TRRDLRSTPLVDVRAGALPVRRARVGPRCFQSGESRAIHLLEGQLRLESLLRSRVEIGSRAQGPFGLEFQPIALKAETPRRPSDSPVHRVATRWADRLRAFAFELAAWKANPILCHKLRVWLPGAARHLAS